MIDVKLFDKWANAGLFGKNVFINEDQIYYLLKNQYEYNNSLKYKKHAEKFIAFYLALISKIFSPDFILWKLCSVQTYRSDNLKNGGPAVAWLNKSIVLSPYEWTEYLIDIELINLNDSIDSIAENLFPLIDQLKAQILRDVYYNLKIRMRSEHRHSIDLWNLWEFLYEGTSNKVILGNTSTLLKLDGTTAVGDNFSPINKYEIYGSPCLPEDELIIAPIISNFVYSPNVIFYKSNEKLLTTLRNFHLFDSNDPILRIKLNSNSNSNLF